MKLLALAISSALISTATFASDTFNFDYVGAGYAKFQIEDEDGDGHMHLNGFTVEASKQLNENWVVSSQYVLTSRDSTRSGLYWNDTLNVYTKEEIDFTQWHLGAAYLIPLEQGTVLELVSSFGRMTYDYSREYKETVVENDQSDRHSPYYGEHRHIENKDHTNTFGLEANYHITLLDNLKASAGLGYQHISDADDKHELVYQLELAYDITNDFTISAAYRNVDVFENYFVTVRYNF